MEGSAASVSPAAQEQSDRRGLPEAVPPEHRVPSADADDGQQLGTSVAEEALESEPACARASGGAAKKPHLWDAVEPELMRLMEQQLRCIHPSATDGQIQARLVDSFQLLREQLPENSEVEQQEAAKKQSTISEPEPGPEPMPTHVIAADHIDPATVARALAARKNPMLDYRTTSEACMLCEFKFTSKSRQQRCHSCGWIVCHACTHPEAIELEAWFSDSKVNKGMLRVGTPNSPTKRKSVCVICGKDVPLHRIRRERMEAEHKNVLAQEMEEVAQLLLQEHQTKLQTQEKLDQARRAQAHRTSRAAIARRLDKAAQEHVAFNEELARRSSADRKLAEKKAKEAAAEGARAKRDA
eukprot:COSAG02_NODE_10090_length_2027_cov_59.184129_3_plen_354_part_01